ncbi:hypothetical protein V8F20_012629 [Naviculisporaceae sp. PSN 640]
MAPRRGKHQARGSKAAQLRAAAGLPTTRDFPPSSSSFTQGFSMRDEARNTASHHFSWGQDARLRQKPVAFISAGFTEPLKDIKSMDDPGVRVGEEPVDEQDVESGTAILGKSVLDVHKFDAVLSETPPGVDNEPEALTKKSKMRADDEPAIDFDTEQPASGNDRASPPRLAFFFDLEGDRSLRPAGPKVVVPVRASSPARSDSSEEIILFKGRSGHARRHQTGQRQPNALSDGKACEGPPLPVQAIAGSNPPSTALNTRPDNEPGSLGSSSGTQEDGDDAEDEEDAILADYIANMAAQSDDDPVSQFHGVFSTGRDLGGDHDAFDFGLDENGVGKAPGKSPDYNSDATSNSDDDNNGDRDGNGDASDNEVAVDVDDESLARLLAKQDELGMGTDKLLLRDGYCGALDTRTGGGSSSRISQVNVSGVADDFKGLDLTDWNDPNFRKPGRARRSKQPPAFNVSDSELEVALRAAWQTDRERKKKRKLERELLRSEGLLGRNVNPDDPRVKYQTHMAVEDMKVEFVSFLLSSAETIQFPPMDHDARRIVHELARKFNIKTKSTGNGDQRRPVLYRTKRTVRYTESSAREARNHVEMAAVTIRRKVFYRPDKKEAGISRPSNARISGGHKAVTYREGEVVGASAPQLGQDNKGHAMLEKMGWSKGMALGALENKGILEPVSQVVKRSKAGLG